MPDKLTRSISALTMQIMTVPTAEKSLTHYGLWLLLSISLAGCELLPGRDGATSPDDDQYLVNNSSDVWERLEADFGVEDDDYSALSLDLAEEGVLANDLWDRIRAGLAFPDRSHPAAFQEATDYASNADNLDVILQRGEPYLYYVVEEIEKRGMPTELALLPIIESAYRPISKSNKGASGIWQFIPSTGKFYGLKTDFWYDGRRDVIASTQAALKYFEKLNADFDGDWLLALAAYNCGEGAVMRAINKNAEAGKPTDFWSLDLPRETEEYVPRLLGVAALVADPESFSVSLRRIPNSPYLTSIALDKQINLKEAAKLADISHDEIKHLNPGFRTGVTDPKGQHNLLLPADKAAGFNTKLAGLSFSERLAIGNDDAAKSSHSSKKPSGKPTTYKVKRGDSLYIIAQRFKTTVAKLREWNPRDATAKHLKPGSVLTLYLAAR